MVASRTYSRTCERRRRRRPRPVVSHEVLSSSREAFAASSLPLILPLHVFSLYLFPDSETVVGGRRKTQSFGNSRFYSLLFFFLFFFPTFSFFFCFLSRSIVVFLFSPEAASVRGVRLIFGALLCICTCEFLNLQALLFLHSEFWEKRTRKKKEEERASERERERERENRFV